jgi:hypothetical protein
MQFPSFGWFLGSERNGKCFQGTKSPVTKVDLPSLVQKSNQAADEKMENSELKLNLRTNSVLQYRRI